VISVPYDEELFGLAMDFAYSPELATLKKRFEGFGACKDHATAAAFGYLAAMKDAQAKEEGPTIGDQVVVAIEEAMEGETDAEYAGEMIMALVYQWLHKEMNEDGWDDDDYAITTIKSLFAPFVTPGVIKQ
jgi:hypothetical protein